MITLDEGTADVGVVCSAGPGSFDPVTLALGRSAVLLLEAPSVCGGAGVGPDGVFSAPPIDASLRSIVPSGFTVDFVPVSLSRVGTSRGGRTCAAGVGVAWPAGGAALSSCASSNGEPKVSKTPERTASRFGKTALCFPGGRATSSAWIGWLRKSPGGDTCGEMLRVWGITWSERKASG